MTLSIDKREFENNGFVAFDGPKYYPKFADMLAVFKSKYLLDHDSAETVRRRITLFAQSPEVQAYLSLMSQIIKQLDIDPVYCGPAVTHYTSNNSIGNSFGLGWHQDYPSMASSKRSVILWTSLTASSSSTHGMEVIPGSHKEGLLKGSQTEQGYYLDLTAKQQESAKVLELENGGICIFSSFLAHRTFVNSEFKQEKISFSQRFDDIGDQNWAAMGYPNAYKITVDRELYKNTL